MSQKSAGFTIIEIVMVAFASVVLAVIGFAIYRANSADPAITIIASPTLSEQVATEKTTDQQKSEALAVVKKVYDAYAVPVGTSADNSAKAQQGAKDNSAASVAVGIESYDSVLCAQTPPQAFTYGEPVLALDGKSVSVPVIGMYEGGKENKLTVIVDSEATKLIEIVCSKP